MTRLVVGWDVFAALYLVLAYSMMLRCGVGHIRRSAVMQDDGRFLMLLLTALGAFASLAAIVFELGASKGNPAGLALATVTIVLSWAVVHTAFALHYAHEFYRGSKPGGLQFPSGDAAGRGGLLGLRLFLVRDRHDRAGFRRRHHRQDHPPHRDRARHHLVRVQYRADRADGEYRRERDLSARCPGPSLQARIHYRATPCKQVVLNHKLLRNNPMQRRDGCRYPRMSLAAACVLQQSTRG